MKNSYHIYLLGIIFFLSSCNESSQKNNAQSRVKHENKNAEMLIPDFNSDSAYAFIEKQLSFGTRVPNTPSHDACGNWIESKLKEFGADVIVQKALVEAYDGTKLNISNYIGQYGPEKANRLLLMAHWDTRPVADYDPDPDKRDLPIPGANDGASGVAVLLEVARQLSNSQPALGVDIVLFDAEDYGCPEHLDIEWTADSWCLGSQYWSKNPHVEDYYARYGILLDMVGGANAIFTQEEVSVYYAQSVIDNVWQVARDLGYSSRFSREKTPQIVDDHRYVNEILGIPSVDIIQYDHSTESHFGTYWHTHDDNIDAVDKQTLKAVGEVVINVIFKEK